MYLILSNFTGESLGYNDTKACPVYKSVRSFLYYSDFEMHTSHGTWIIGKPWEVEINGKPVENSTALSK